MKEKWYTSDYRRNLVDMHIEDWDESFLSEYDPQKYVEMLKKANVKGAMIYANSHIGYCYWPTKTGKMHKGLKGRDILGEVIDLCHKEGMDVIVYYTLIYDNWAYDQSRSWRIIDVNGKSSREKPGIRGMIASGRYGVCCPNSQGYRDYTLAQIEDFGKRYDFEGVFFDMTFWPDICYCDSCKERFAREVGGDIPTVIDWNDPNWVAFQKKREEWIGEFAKLATEKIKEVKPGVTVDHQFSPSLHSWSRGVTEGTPSASDYCGGDFYGGLLQQSFICKLFYNLTNNRPFEFHTSRCFPNLHDHTTMKSKELLEIQNYLTIAHNGAFLFIDAIDPVGTLNPKVYETLGEVYAKSEKYEPYFGGEMAQDVAVYFSLNSKMNFDDNGNSVQDYSEVQPHLDAALGAARTLRQGHIPFGVISRKNLSALSTDQILVLPDVLMLDVYEAETIKGFVNDGGSLYASGHTSQLLLADLFGTNPEGGETHEDLTYIAPNDRGSFLFPDIEAKYPLTIFGRQILCTPCNPEEVMATITLPYTDPHDHLKVASIHSDPPGIPTDHPAVIYRKYGKGRVIWAAAPLEAAEQLPHRNTFTQMIKTLAIKPFAFESDCPKVVEMTLFHQPDKKRIILNFINIQDILPCLPIMDLTFRVRLDNKKFKSASIINEDKDFSVITGEGYAEIKLSRLDVFSMFAIDYE
jgi:hypothetical protein